ncbi:glycosyltransferase [Paenibacillus sp. LHD-38]|uniref:tetratricopeptide repeat-containing glycosyltransferase family 2 protein n=1 Tax=Paenibacillus sp. LHD-38 TaxID=3072143 RepID=UPI00281074B6|nr:glycosyltransferase [Paenibacillus sp. LHD-38]MDQ8738632.1 glycosyltransferase [Paenibacillus sp. LHD-38]
MAKKKPKLTLCMVVRNEELLLPRCLESVKDLADEMIIVDTGSTDRTVQIAEQAGAIVFHEPWEQNFSKPLNRALREAKGEWILRLDGDEELIAEDKGKLRKLMIDPRAEGYIFSIISLLNDQNVVEEEVSSFIRLYRNRPEYVYEGLIHEQVIPSIYRRDPKAVIKSADVRIKHYGYLKEISDAKNKGKRNLEITLEAIKCEPDNGYLRFYMGVEYRRQNEREQSAAQFAEAMKRFDPKLPWASRCIQAHTTVLMELGLWDQAMSVAQEGIRFYPDYTDLVYLRGVIHHQQGDQLAAVSDFSTCIAMGDPVGLNYVVSKGIGGYKSYYALGLAYRTLGRNEEAVTAYENSYKLFPTRSVPLYEIATIQHNVQSPPWIGDYLEKIMPQPNMEKYPVIADILLSLREYESAEKFIAAMVNHDPNYQFRYLLGGCYRKRGAYNDAIRELSQIPVSSPYYVEARLHLYACYQYENEPEKAKDVLLQLNGDENLFSRLALLFLEDSKDILVRGGRRFPEVKSLSKELEKIEEAIQYVGK